MPSCIHIGCRVSSCVGPLQKELEPGKKRCTRCRLTGTVIGSLHYKRWHVYWDGIGKVADHPLNKLKFVSPAPMNNPLAGLELEHLMADCYMPGGQNELDKWFETAGNVGNIGSIIGGGTRGLVTAPFLVETLLLVGVVVSIVVASVLLAGSSMVMLPILAIPTAAILAQLMLVIFAAASASIVAAKNSSCTNSVVGGSGGANGG
eukprot:CAMPEP_0178924388 /NCGR_PEP_ID=MMETSP0786-20121207/17298_1 /TAXON_ID=186022 /ORGANISM="Thalassionema frauenfeldii, Strain CCMP 1798" /LENGTH=204 /DNA_ID=CAMNT_0020599091 /DNA_START=459 /DNA_END=1069 /DNA_ORIENTATION=-